MADDSPAFRINGLWRIVAQVHGLLSIHCDSLLILFEQRDAARAPRKTSCLQLLPGAYRRFRWSGNFLPLEPPPHRARRDAEQSGALPGSGIE